MDIRILLAEDNDTLREVIADFLMDQGYVVDAVKNGLLAWEAFQENQYQLILLDVMMPEMDGFELCKKIRAQEEVPILFLTARVQEQDQLQGYALGADDYILKPFSLPVLLAKCKVILERRNAGTTGTGNWINAGNIRLNLDTQQVLSDGKDISLQALDYRMLCYFMQNLGRVFSREQLLLKLWGYDYEGNDRSVDTHVKKLRKALGKNGSYIKTVVKTGYKFEVGK